MSREARVSLLSLEILNLIRTSENASLLASDEIKEAFVRARSIIEFLIAPLEQNESTAPTKRAGKKKDEPVTEPVVIDVESYDATNREHKKLLVQILKQQHEFDFNNELHQTMASEINTELAKLKANLKDRDVMCELIQMEVERATARRGGAPF